MGVGKLELVNGSIDSFKIHSYTGLKTVMYMAPIILFPAKANLQTLLLQAPAFS